MLVSKSEFLLYRVEGNKISKKVAHIEFLSIQFYYLIYFNFPKWYISFTLMK